LQHAPSIPAALDAGIPAGEAWRMEVVLFVPGFFGFGSFGHLDRPLIEYFARVEDALLRAHVRPLRFAVHEPPPAGPLAERVRSLHVRAAEILRDGATRLHLVGHSTGGLDARLLAHPRYAALPERADLIARIGSLTTLSAPFHGTPLARRGGDAAWFAVPALWFGSILASRGRLRLAGQVATLFNLAKRASLQKPTPTDQVIAQLADVDDGTAQQIRRFLADVARDHRLVRDLVPETMAELNRVLQGGDRVSSVNFVSVAPRPGFSPWAFASAPLQRLLYDVTYRLTADPPREPARVPEGPWIGRRRIALASTSNDGIVPAWSQTLDGRAAGIVLGDHLDVIGHYEAAGATFLRSGSSFDHARFRALWEQVGRCILLA
jgi:triacylglycerol lipase